MTDLKRQAEILSVRDVGVSYGKTQVINSINLSVRAGTFFGLIGLNGVGKTTLIKSILGLRTRYSGDIRILGKAPADKAVKKDIAYLPERFEPPWFLTGAEFLTFSLQLYGRKRDEVLFAEKAEALALDPAALKRRVHTYSKGMRQKLGLLGTLLTGCNLLILDEPMSGLDPAARTLVKDMLLDARAQGRTVFLSSHILADMDEICDEVSVLHAGTIRFTGAPQELKDRTDSENLERAFLCFIDKTRFEGAQAA